MKTTPPFTCCLAVLSLLGLSALSRAQESNFEIARVDPGAGVKTRVMVMEIGARKAPVAVETTPTLTRADIREIAAAPQGDAAALLITFTDAGRRKFSELTRAWQGRQLGVVIDGRLVATPRVRDAINTGQLAIRGNFDANESRLLAASLNDAALPAIAEPPQQKSREPALKPFLPGGKKRSQR